MSTWPSGKDTRIVRAEIHPGIGIARVGNSREPDGYYIGPEVPNPPPTLPGQNRDAKGAIKRQAARFHIYGYYAAGEVVAELDSGNASIVWTAHLVNRKAQWYQFQAALDIPEEAGQSVPLRNPKVKGKDREGLAIDPGPRSIEGKGTSGPAYQFDSGTFQGTPVPLGEIRTDQTGCLLVLGGFGYSASPKGTPIFIPEEPTSFNNADGWFDDINMGKSSRTWTISSLRSNLGSFPSLGVPLRPTLA